MGLVGLADGVSLHVGGGEPEPSSCLVDTTGDRLSFRTFGSAVGVPLTNLITGFLSSVFPGFTGAGPTGPSKHTCSGSSAARALASEKRLNASMRVDLVELKHALSSASSLLRTARSSSIMLSSVTQRASKTDSAMQVCLLISYEACSSSKMSIDGAV